MTTPLGNDSPIKALRLLFAWALLAYVAVVLLFSALRWLIPGDGTDIFDRSADANGAVTGLLLIAMPLLATLITGYVKPAAPMAQLVALVSTLALAVIVLFGLLTFLLGLGTFGRGLHTARDSFGAFEAMLLSAIRLGIAGLATVATFRIYTGLGGKLPKAP